jgi:hypothetical protein
MHILTKGLAGSCELTADVEHEPAKVLECFFETFYASFVLVGPFVESMRWKMIDTKSDNVQTLSP